MVLIGIGAIQNGGHIAGQIQNGYHGMLSAKHSHVLRQLLSDRCFLQVVIYLLHLLKHQESRRQMESPPCFEEHVMFGFILQRKRKVHFLWATQRNFQAQGGCK